MGAPFEFRCDRLFSADVRDGRIALAFEHVVVLLSAECARAVGDVLDELREIDESGAGDVNG
jgi:hypothetical protein